MLSTEEALFRKGGFLPKRAPIPTPKHRNYPGLVKKHFAGRTPAHPTHRVTATYREVSNQAEGQLEGCESDNNKENRYLHSCPGRVLRYMVKEDTGVEAKAEELTLLLFFLFLSHQERIPGEDVPIGAALGGMGQFMAYAPTLSSETASQAAH